MTEAMSGKPRIETVPDISDRARQLLRQSIIVDAVLPWTEEFNGREFDRLLPRWRNVGVTCVSLTVAGGDSDLAYTMFGVEDWIKNVTAEAEAAGMRIIRTTADIAGCKRDALLGLSFNFQDALPFARSLELVERYYRLGVRQVGLVYNIRNFVGDGCAEEADAGLSRFGRTLIAELNRVGMIIDGTHVGCRTSMEAIELTTKPFIFSHSNPHGVRPHYRSVNDEQMKAAAATGGSIGINGVGFWTGDMDAGTESIFRCLDYAVSLIGDEHVHLGFDYIWDLDELFAWADRDSLLWPPYKGERMVKHNYAGPEQIADLVDHMVRHGYEDGTIKKILGGNYLRVAAANWTN